MIRVYDETGDVIEAHECAGDSTNRKTCLDLSSERIDDGVHGSSCALHDAVPNILGCLRSALRHVGCPVDGARLNAANGDGGDDREKDR